MNLAQSGEPRISSITATNGIQIHYDAEITPQNVSYVYVLQYTSNLLSTNWSNLQTGHSFPFPWHYDIPDPGARSNAARFYRLRVTIP